MSTTSRREFLRRLGISGAALPFLLNLPSLGFANQGRRKQRMVVIFSPNGVLPNQFWPDEEGDSFKLKPILEPLAPFQKQTLILKGLCDKVRGDGDNHMRGMGCLLTGIELFPGNIQGGSDTPAGWASGISIDQEIKNYLQANPQTRTRFGSLEFGVMVPDRADTWTRMVYTGANKPVAPVDDPYQMFNKLYGQMKDREHLRSILDDVQQDLKRVGSVVSSEDRRLIDEHATFVREMEQELNAAGKLTAGHDGVLRAPDPDHGPDGDHDHLDHAVPELEPGVKEENDNIPRISKMQIDLMVNSFAADFSRLATFQITNSVGGARMKWIGVDEGHHELSHHPDSEVKTQEKLTKINRWYCEQVAYLAKRLSETPEPGGPGSLLDNTLIIWTNELGKGNSHTLDDIPFVLVGGGLDFKMGRSVRYRKLPHNRLLMSLAHGFGHRIERFGNADFCGAGTLPKLT